MFSTPPSTAPVTASARQQQIRVLVHEHLGDAAGCITEAIETIEALCKKDPALTETLSATKEQAAALRRDLESIKARHHLVAFPKGKMCAVAMPPMFSPQSAH